jgi:glucose-6-phosphate isomerase
MIPILDLKTGITDGSEPHSVRTLAELAPIFATPVDPERGEETVYEIYGLPSEVEGPARLLYATTILHPGHVDGEFFMTRGHFHTDPTRGEFMVTLNGQGSLILMDREGKTWTEGMKTGSVHDIDGHHAHRVANTGPEPLVFLVVWMSDCGHDYESIRERGFGIRVRATDSSRESKETFY